MSSFINQVSAFVNNGSLTPTQGQALLDAANAVQTALGCSFAFFNTGRASARAVYNLQ